MGAKEIGSRQYGMFAGVFIPTFLTIIGVILFLRLGLIVGSVGPLNSILIVLLAASVSISTGLSLSSIITNIRVGSGGAYSIISKTLGLEVGGSVGIPLYLAQIFSVALYIFGFSEIWHFIFPDHPKILVLFSVFFLLIFLTMISTKIAMKTQLIVFIIILVSLFSIFIGGNGWVLNMSSISNFNSGGDFWIYFALFFPAITGLMAGIGMSGELSDPKKQIPRGIMSALFITTLIYIVMILFFAATSSQTDLVNNNLILVSLGVFGPLVMLGILASTFSSALTTLVAAPRLLQALAESRIIPMSSFFAKKTIYAEPLHSLLLSALIVAVLLPIGSLNTIAPFLTVFFLISYSMINLSVFIEQSLSLVSFRPIFTIPKIVPLYGFFSSLIIIFYINPLAGFFSLIFLLGIYSALTKKNLRVSGGDVRSGLFRAVTEWGAKKVKSFPEGNKHVWEPNIYYPINSREDVEKGYTLLRGILKNTGTLSILGILVNRKKRRINLDTVEKQLKEDSIFSTISMVKTKDFFRGLSIALQTVRGQLFRPNSVILNAKDYNRREIEQLFEISKGSKLGLIFYKKQIEIKKEITVWVPENAIDKNFFEDSNFDLGMLVGYQLAKNWRGKIVIRMNVSHHKRAVAKRFLYKLVYESRFPKNTKIIIEPKNVDLHNIHGLHIVPVKDKDDYFRKMSTYRHIDEVLFVKDSSREDVLA